MPAGTWDRIGEWAVAGGDPELERIRKVGVTRMAVLGMGVAAGYAIALGLAGAARVAWLPLAFVVGTGANLAGFRAHRRREPFVAGQVTMLLLLVGGLHASLGGMHGSGGVLGWGVLAPLAAMAFGSRLQARVACAGLLVLLLACGACEPQLAVPGHSLSASAQTRFWVGNGIALAGVLYLVLQRFMEELEREQEEARRLLLNVLPEPVAARLRAGERPIADRIEEASVLFADVVGFTPLAARLTAPELVVLLDEIFQEFDRLAVHRGLEKIKTIGDAYMAAAGVPVPRSDHADAAVSLGCDMLRAVGKLNGRRGAALSLRVGVHSGPLVAGVIGLTKFSYDLWGETVNLASRMESHGVPGVVQISTATRQRLGGRFEIEERGPIPVKGVGEVRTCVVHP